MEKSRRLPKELNKGPFSVKLAKKFGLTRLQVARLKSEGLLMSLETGIYAASDYQPRPHDTFRIATLKFGPMSAICLLSALWYHGFADKREPTPTWILVPSSKRTVSENYALLRSRNARWEIGIENCDGFKVTCLERTFVDCLLHRNLIDEGIVREAARKLANRKGALQKIISTAQKLNVAHRVQPYLEVLL